MELHWRQKATVAKDKRFFNPSLQQFSMEIAYGKKTIQKIVDNNKDLG